MTSDEQLASWVGGKSIHNVDKGECCQDFSCCQPELLAPQAERELFRDRPEVRHQMLMGFLGRALASWGDKIHIAGSIEGEA